MMKRLYWQRFACVNSVSGFVVVIIFPLLHRSASFNFVIFSRYLDVYQDFSSWVKWKRELYHKKILCKSFSMEFPHVKPYWYYTGRRSSKLSVTLLIAALRIKIESVISVSFQYNLNSKLLQSVFTSSVTNICCFLHNCCLPLLTFPCMRSILELFYVKITFCFWHKIVVMNVFKHLFWCCSNSCLLFNYLSWYWGRTTCWERLKNEGKD